ncbi:MAG: carbohydrate porin [Gemmataceae bacterium]
MPRIVILPVCLALLAAAPVALGQTTVEPPPQPVPPPAVATTLGVPSTLENGQPDPSVLYPTIRPGDGGQPVAAPTVCPTCDKPPESFWTRPTMTGDWGGLRPRLQDRGVTFQGNVTQFFYGLDGGVNRALPFPGFPLQPDNSLSYTGRGDYAFTFDLEKLGSPLPKGQLLVRAQNWWGQFGNVSLPTGSLSLPVVAAATPVVPNDPGTPFITDFLLTQPLSKNWVVFMGKKSMLGAVDQDDFAGGNGINQFSNFGLVGNPSLLLAMPYSSFTAGMVSPREWGSVTAYVLDPQDRTKNFFSLDSLFSQGIILGGEVKVKTSFFNLPGEQHVGGIYKNVQLTDLRFNEPPPGQYPETAVPGFPTLRNSYTIYYGFDQYVQVYSEDTKRGWGLFGRASVSDGNPTPIRYFLSAGIGGYSPFRYREGDTFGIGWYYLGASNQFGPLPRVLIGPTDGWGTELYYNVQLTPWMNLTTDFQIVQPGSRAIANTAYIAGIRLNLKF